MRKRVSLYTGVLCESSDANLGFGTAALVKIQVFTGGYPVTIRQSVKIPQNLNLV